MTRQEIILNEYRNRIEVADNVLSETRAKLTKAEHDRDRYKAEIERLKAQQREIERLKDDYAKLQELFAQYQMASDKEIRAQVKQAKIDVLNELKKKIHDTRLNDDTAEIIIEMIEELQNAEDKS